MAQNPKKSPQTQTLMYVGLAIAAFFLIDPFGLFAPGSPGLPNLDNEVYENYAVAVEALSTTPGSALVQAAAGARITYITESTGFAEQASFTAAQLPSLVRDAGIEIIGFWFLQPSDQARIDAFMAQSFYDEAAANALLFARSPIAAGYAEYRDMLKAAWEVSNAGYPVRLLGMSELEDFSKISSAEDMQDPEKLATAYPNGLPDQVMANIAIAALEASPNAKALFFISIYMSMPGFVNNSFRTDGAALGFQNQNQFAQILYERGFTDTAVVGFHVPWPSRLGRLGAWYPVSGVLDAVFNRMALENRLPAIPFGFATQGTLGEIVLSNNLLSAGYGENGVPALEFADLFDVYIVTAGIGGLHPMQPIEGLVNQQNLAQAILLTPIFAAPEELTVQQYSQHLQRVGEQWQSIISELAY